MFRQVTLGNPKIKAVVRDLRFHHDPVGQSVLLDEDGMCADDMLS